MRVIKVNKRRANVVVSRKAVLEVLGLSPGDTPEVLYHRSATPFVASFVGSPPMNTLAAVVDAGGTAARIDGTATDVPLPAAVDRLAPGRAVVLGIRMVAEERALELVQELILIDVCDGIKYPGLGDRWSWHPVPQSHQPRGAIEQVTMGRF